MKTVDSQIVFTGNAVIFAEITTELSISTYKYINIAVLAVNKLTLWQ
jgi:hypothetical protein